MSGSNIPAIIDYSAQRVGLYVAGIASVSGVGTGAFPDPLRPGQTIQAATEKAVEPWAHQSVEPSAPSCNWFTQDGMYEVIWRIPMRLWAPKLPVDEVRRALLPFYDRYLAAFAPDPTLGGLCATSHIASFRIEQSEDRESVWLAIDLEATEYPTY